MSAEKNTSFNWSSVHLTMLNHVEELPLAGELKIVTRI